MGIDTIPASGDIDETLRQREGKSVVKKKPREPLRIGVNPELDVGAGSIVLAQGIGENLEAKDTKDFIKLLKNYLPKDLQSQVENITAEDIGKMIALLLGAAILIASGVVLAAAIASVGARLGVQALMLRIGVYIVSRPGSTSAIMGLIPGMKGLAPNQSIAFGVSEMRNLILYILPGMTTKAFSELQTQRNK